MKKQSLSLLSICLFSVLGNSLVFAADVKQDDQQAQQVQPTQQEKKLVTPDALNVIREDSQKQLASLSLKVQALKEKVDKEKSIVRSFNQNVIFITNNLNDSNLKIATPLYQKSITYQLAIDFANKEIFYDTLFVNDTLSNNKNMVMPAMCVNTCTYESFFTMVDGEKIPFDLVLERTDDPSRLKITEDSYSTIVNNLEFAEFLTIKPNNFLGQDVFNFYVKLSK